MNLLGSSLSTPVTAIPNVVTRAECHPARHSPRVQQRYRASERHVHIGRHCRIRRAIIDRDVHIPEGTVIGYDPVEDKRRYFVTPSGLTIVTRDASLFENPVDPEFLERY